MEILALEIGRTPGAIRFVAVPSVELGIVELDDEIDFVMIMDYQIVQTVAL
jgi:hypothetical protein